MRNVNSLAFETVASLGESIYNLQLDKTSGIYKTPYSPKPLESFHGDNLGLIMYKAEDIAFCNTSEFTKTAQAYLKTGKYTDAHPKYDSAEYNAFWDKEEDKCKNGLTLPGKLLRQDDGSYKMQDVHITGEHYGYLNFAEIKRSKGFEINKGILYGANGEIINKTNSGISAKDFYFPDFWDGDYYFFKAIELCKLIGRHLVVGKARRKGYSYKNGWLVSNNANFYRRSTSVVGAYDSASLFDDGTMNKVLNYLDFINKHTAWTKRRIHNTLEHVEIGFRYKNDEAKYGYLSNIYTAILKGNPGGLRGKDPNLVLLEEFGKCPNGAEILDATMKSLTDGEHMTGLFIGFGTGGGEDNQWQAFEDTFYEPYARDFVCFENEYDDDMLGTGCGYFHGSFMNKPGLIDVHGNSDIKGSLAFDAVKIKQIQHDPSKLNAYMMEEPTKPSEAFSRASNNIFPAKELDEQLRRVMRDPNLQGIGREGIFVQTATSIKFIDKLSADEEQKVLIPQPVNNYPLKPEDDVAGCWVLWEQPFRNKDGTIPDNLYSAWNDPYGISKEKDHFNVKDSMGVTWIYENPNNFTPTKGDRVVACFVGRREDTEEYDDEMFLGCLYFNAKLLYENDRGDVYTNAKKRGLLDLLKDEPGFHYQKELQKGGMGRKKGISIAGNAGRKASSVVYLKNWLIQNRGIDDKGNKLLNLHYIYDIGVLKELLKYDGKRNTDRVSAFLVGMFDIRETIHKGQFPEVNRLGVLDDNYFKNPFG